MIEGFVHQQTLSTGSLPDLLTTEEVELVSEEIRSHMHAADESYDVEQRKRSVHAVDGLSLRETKLLYEPQGRVECDTLPDHIHKRLNAAVHQRLPDIRTIFPGATRAMDWIYVEYHRGQFVSVHADYSQNESHPSHPKLAAISITLEMPESGGEFFFASPCDTRMWMDNQLREGVNEGSDWFNEISCPRWTSQPVEPGSALLWGTQLPHGTLPVAAGVARKIVGFLGTDE